MPSSEVKMPPSVCCVSPRLLMAVLLSRDAETLTCAALLPTSCRATSEVPGRERGREGNMESKREREDGGSACIWSKGRVSGVSWAHWLLTDLKHKRRK